MSDNILTPENVRATAEVVERFAAETLGLVAHCARPDEYKVNAVKLRNYADRLEREQAVEAKRAKRIEELAMELCCQLQQGLSTHSWLSTTFRSSWLHLASRLLDRYPSLLDEPKEP